MSNLVQRILSGVVALPLLGLLILWRQPLGFGVLVLVIAGLALHEYLAITLPGTSVRLRALLIAAGVGLSAGLYLAPGLAHVWIAAAFIAATRSCCSTPVTSTAPRRGWGLRCSASSIWGR